jgi:hypothetical protein
MFSSFQYACSSFRDDRSSTLLRSDKKKKCRERRERKIVRQMANQRDTKNVPTLVWKNDEKED